MFKLLIVLLLLTNYCFTASIKFPIPTISEVRVDHNHGVVSNNNPRGFKLIFNTSDDNWEMKLRDITYSYAVTKSHSKIFVFLRPTGAVYDDHFRIDYTVNGEDVDFEGSVRIEEL